MHLKILDLFYLRVPLSSRVTNERPLVVENTYLRGAFGFEVVSLPETFEF